MPEMVPQLTPKFWIMRRKDGTRFVEASKFAGYDPTEFHFATTVVEAVIQPELTYEFRELYKAVAALDHALGARTPPHLRDLIAALILQAYEAGVRSKEKK